MSALLYAAIYATCGVSYYAFFRRYAPKMAMSHGEMEAVALIHGFFWPLVLPLSVLGFLAAAAIDQFNYQKELRFFRFSLDEQIAYFERSNPAGAKLERAVRDGACCPSCEKGALRRRFAPTICQCSGCRIPKAAKKLGYDWFGYSCTECSFEHHRLERAWPSRR